MIKRMRILINSINYSPELTGIGKYNGEMAEWLTEQGHEVRVITAPPYYPAWQVSEGYSSYRYYHEQLNGVDIIRCPLWIPKSISGLTRIIHLLSFAISSAPIVLWEAIKWRPDFIFVVEPPLFCAPAALFAARLSGSKAWLHVQDFEVDAAFDLGILRSAWLRRLVLAAERWLMQRFDRVSTISERMLDRLRHKGVLENRRFLFPNWVDLDNIFPLPAKSSLRREWGISNSEIVVLYAGNMGEKQGIEILLDAASLLRGNHTIRFILCGDGAARHRLEKHAQGLPNVLFKPLQPLARLNDLLNLADIHALPQRADAEDLVLPSKITNMLASGRPIIATASQETQIAQVLHHHGMVVAPGNVEQLVAAIIKLSGDRELREILGRTGRQFATTNWAKNEILGHSFSF